MKTLGKLTVEKIEPKYGTIGKSPVVNRFTRTHNGISQGDEVTNGGTRPQVLQVWSRGTVHTTFGEILVLLFGRIYPGIQFIEVSLVELSRNGLVYISDHCVVEVSCIFLRVIENVNLPGAGCATRSENHIMSLRSERTMCAPLHEGPRRLYHKHPGRFG
jgi:hypothetical protein